MRCLLPIGFCWIVVSLLSVDATGNKTGNDDNVQQKPASVIEMGVIVSEYIGVLNAAKLVMYGCYCGLGSRGNTPVDAIDSCCRAHDNCYADGTSGSWWTRKCTWDFKVQLYSFSCKGGTCHCEDSASSCAGMACRCDLTFAKCVKKNWAVYNPLHHLRC